VPKLDIFQSLGCRLGAPELQQVIRQVDRQDTAGRPDEASRGKSGCASAAADVENRGSGS
jgi:hypothetical protein